MAKKVTLVSSITEKQSKDLRRLLARDRKGVSDVVGKALDLYLQKRLSSKQGKKSQVSAAVRDLEMELRGARRLHGEGRQIPADLVVGILQRAISTLQSQ